MRVKILIERWGRPAISAGTIALRNGALACDPSSSPLLRDILQQPLSLPIEGRMRDVYADTDATLFLQSLHRVYQGPFLRATPVEVSPAYDAAIVREGVGASDGIFTGHDGVGQQSREAAPREESASVSASRTDASNHEQPR